MISHCNLQFPRVSIVTPSYNQGEFLEETICSVLAQDYPNIEYIVIDGDSSDGSVDIIQRYEEHLSYWISEPDKGQTDALIKGFAQASGEVLVWLNADDLLEPSAVSCMVYAFIKEGKAVGVIYGNRTRIDHKGNVIGFRTSGPFRHYRFRTQNLIPQECTFFRKDVYDQVGGLDKSLNYVMDLDLWCRMQQVTQIRHIPAFIGRYREHAAAKSYDFTVREMTPHKQEYTREKRRVQERYFRPFRSRRVVRLFRELDRLEEVFYSRSKRYKLYKRMFKKIRTRGLDSVLDLQDED